MDLGSGWTSDVVIRSATTADDITGIFNLSEEEHWNVSKETIATLIEICEEFIVADLKGTIIGARMVFKLDQYTASVGFFVVKSQFRGSKVAKQIAARALSIAQDRNLVLWTLPARLGRNMELGMHVGAGDYSYLYYCRGRIDPDTLTAEPVPGTPQVKIVPICDANADELLKYDTSVCTFSRPKFIQIWPAKPSAIAYAAVTDDGEVLGYGVARAAPETYFISPLYANTTPIMMLILKALLKAMPGDSEVDMYTHVENEAAKIVLQENKDTFTRMHEEHIRFMFTKRQLKVPKFQSVFAVSCAGTMPI